MAWPKGVVVPYARAIIQGLKDVGGSEGMAAMRDPRARPSKVSIRNSVNSPVDKTP